jgi:hypothetical protein
VIGTKIMAWIGGAASLGLAAALAYVIISKGAEVRALTLANSNLANDLSQSRINASRLEGALAAQSAAIGTLAAAGAQREARLADVLATASIASSEARRASDRIVAARPVGDECLAADRLILEEVGR